VLGVQEGLAVGEVANVCVAVWRGPVTRPRFNTQRDALEEVVGRHPEGVGFLCVIEPTSKPPSDELRKESAEMVRRHESVLRCIACVVEGTGFVNALARSTLAAMASMVGPRRVPLAVLGTVSAAATWMAPHIDARDSVVLSRAVESIRAEMAPWVAGAG
jgi:hypothetical protein